MAPYSPVWAKDAPKDDRWKSFDPTDWWTASAEGADPRKTAVDFPRITGVRTSSHYDLVALLDLGAETGLCAVEFPDPPPK